MGALANRNTAFRRKPKFPLRDHSRPPHTANRCYRWVFAIVISEAADVNRLCPKSSLISRAFVENIRGFRWRSYRTREQMFNSALQVLVARKANRARVAHFFQKGVKDGVRTCRVAPEVWADVRVTAMGHRQLQHAAMQTGATDQSSALSTLSSRSNAPQVTERWKLLSCSPLSPSNARHLHLPNTNLRIIA